ncbi:hypothetical protein [Nannocystis pusilla]|uniref:Uncharacterized protein n=1 Tax=Nannocystis pusilla TaxID=889268 RepID=A0ABS7TR55_9BACT|nr:hypothetical protein [Nannocystis pusilla]MBZ5710707.1 hypothetical protein [Nannocystis pusilla]
MAITPGGHGVVAGSLKAGQGTNFWIGAYLLREQYAPAWTFVHDGMGALEHARSVSVGPMGHIYGGGLANGFPAVVYLNP